MEFQIPLDDDNVATVGLATDEGQRVVSLVIDNPDYLDIYMEPEDAMAFATALVVAANVVFQERKEAASKPTILLP